MNELLIEDITDQECFDCGDKLTSWELIFCVMCDGMEDYGI